MQAIKTRCTLPFMLFPKKTNIERDVFNDAGTYTATITEKLCIYRINDVHKCMVNDLQMCK